VVNVSVDLLELYLVCCLFAYQVISDLFVVTIVIGL